MATIRISPTILSPITVTAITSPIIARSTRRVSMPEAAAYSGSKATSVIGRRRSQVAATASVPPTAITTASPRSIPAVEPSRKDSSPAWRPADIDWITVRSTMPSPKNTDSTAPIAASSPRRVREAIHSTTTSPIAAVIAEPARRPRRLRPSPPSATMTMKAAPTPGSVACATASETSARLRKNRNVPAAPAAKPSIPAPTATSAAL